VPDVLLSGDHKRVAEWKEAESRRLTNRSKDRDGS